MNLNLIDDSWAPDACTLPTAEQPLRIAEFDSFFAQGVTGLTWTDGGGLVLAVLPETAGQAADLAVKETACCSFFTFELTITGGTADLLVKAPGHADVLTALADRAERLIPGADQ